MKKIILIGLLLLSNQVQAAPPDWLAPVLKVKNPNELAVFTFAGEDCPITGDELRELVSGVLIRSRVKPLLGFEFLTSSLFLTVEVMCADVFTTGGTKSFYLKTFWGNYSVVPPVYYTYGYGRLGSMNENEQSKLKAAIKESVEAAVTDYIAANFDL